MSCYHFLYTSNFSIAKNAKFDVLNVANKKAYLAWSYVFLFTCTFSCLLKVFQILYGTTVKIYGSTVNPRISSPRISPTQPRDHAYLSVFQCYVGLGKKQYPLINENMPALQKISYCLSVWNRRSRLLVEKFRLDMANYQEHF